MMVMMMMMMEVMMMMVMVTVMMTMMTMMMTSCLFHVYRCSSTKLVNSAFASAFVGVARMSLISWYELLLVTFS